MKPVLIPSDSLEIFGTGRLRVRIDGNTYHGFEASVYENDEGTQTVVLWDENHNGVKIFSKVKYVHIEKSIDRKVG